MQKTGKLNAVALGLAAGLLWGLVVMLTTWWLLMIGSPGDEISLLAAFYWGYSYSWIGGLIGLFWGFVDGFVGGALLAYLYNRFDRRGEARAAEGV